MRKILAILVLALFVAPASAQNYSATAGSGLLFGSKFVGSVNYPQWVLCDPTTPANCAKVQAGSSAAIGDLAVTVADPNLLAGITTLNTTAGNPVPCKAAATWNASTGLTGTQPSGCDGSAALWHDLGAVGGTAVQTGTGAVGPGSQRMAVAVDSATVAGSAPVKGGAAVVNGASFYQAVAASQTATVLQSSAGAAGDYLSHCVIYPTSTSPGVVTVFDNTNTAATSAILFPGGASSLSNLVPFAIPVGAVSTAGAWKVTTGSAVSVVCYGKFS